MVKCVDAYPARCATLVALVGGYSPMTNAFYAEPALRHWITQAS
jgi:hypothetical protein